MSFMNMDPFFEFELLITEHMHRLGVPAHVKGHAYIRTAIMLCLEDRGIIHQITKRLYPMVASEYATTPVRVERAIRHAVELAWDRGNVDVLTSYFGYTISSSKGKPTNSEFISLLADRVRLEIMNKYKAAR